MRGEIVSEREAKRMTDNFDLTSCGRVFDKELVERILGAEGATGLLIHVGIEKDKINFVLSAVDDNDQMVPGCELAERGKVPD